MNSIDNYKFCDKSMFIFMNTIKIYNESAVITNAVFVDEYLCFQVVPAFFY